MTRQRGLTIGPTLACANGSFFGANSCKGAAPVYGRQTRFRCHVGHAFNGESLLQYVTEEVESALWTALRVLEEHALLQERMAERSQRLQHAASAAQFHSRAADSRRQAETLRNLLMNQSTTPAEEPKEE